MSRHLIERLTIVHAVSEAIATKSTDNTLGGFFPRTGVVFLGEDRLYSWQRAQDELGYTPEYDLATGVARAIAWYR